MSLTQSWTLDASNSEVVSDLNQILLGLPGTAFVSAGDSADAFKLQVTTNTQAVLDNIQLLTEFGSPLLQITTASAFQASKYPDATFLAELTVPSKRLQGFECAGAGACVLDKGTQAVDQDLSLTASGAGTLFVSTQDIDARFVSISNSGAGNVQWSASRVAAQSLTVSASGTGSVSIASTVEIVPQSAQVQVQGAGSVFFAGSPFNVPTVTSTITGAGNITYLPTAKCGVHTINVGGAGGIYAGSLTSQNTSVVVTGKGRVLVKVVDTLSTNGVGDVEFVGVTPANIQVTKSLWNRGPVLTSVNYYEPFRGFQVPAHDATSIAAATPLPLATPGSTSSPVVPVVSQGTGSTDNPSSGGSFNILMWFLGGLGVAIVVVVVLLRRHIANKHKEYTALK
ncbi:hypothetical protein AeMF1_018821 [Aphanomyces euteiches]|nr:hypothetical protein AeMF1_018821 [Aphanomyces euteiches]KAH9192727.1 hypothetical protein AeNC1_005294 [Aphanomyces euteiches]